MYVSTVSTTIRDLLDDPELDLSLVVEGDLDRPIRWVHVTELADASPYLTGDELILTAGIWRGRGTSALDFVRALETKAVVGLGYGLLDPDEPVPRALIRACEQEQVSLLLVPVNTPFVAITQRFVQRMSEEREADLRKTLAFTTDLIAAVDARDSADALHAVVRLVRRDTGRSTWIADAKGRILASAGRGHSEADVRNAVRAIVAASPQDATTVNVRALRSGRHVSAVIGLWGEDPGLVEQARLDVAVPVVGLVLARERAVRETGRRLAGEFISLVLARQVQAAAARMTSYGLNPQEAAVAMVASVTDGESALTAGEEWLADHGVVGIVALRGKDLYVIAGIETTLSTVAVRQLTESMVAAVAAVAGGVGSVAPDITKLRKSMVQARQSCEFALGRRGGTVMSHELAGSHSLLLALQDQDVLDAFRDALLSALEDYDTRHSSELLTTLRVFLSSGGKWQQTADNLSIHVNTLRNRLAKAEELTRRSLDETGDRVDLWLALETPTQRKAEVSLL
jgi:sugar diacid utilization regulator